MKKKSTGLELVIPAKMRVGGTTFYKRNGQVIGRVSNSVEKRSNTLSQFRQRQKMRHTTMLWKMLRYCDVMFTQRATAYQNFASLANRLPVVYVERLRMDQASFLMPGIPVSDGVLPAIQLKLGEVNGMPALLTDIEAGERHPVVTSAGVGEQIVVIRSNHEKLWLYTAEQSLDGGVMPRVRFSRREVSWDDMTPVEGRLALMGEEFADGMKGWALVRVIGDRCSPQTIVTNCTLYQQYTTEEALQTAAKSYGGLTKTPFPSLK